MKYSKSANENSWREYQRRLKRISRRRYLRSRLPVLGLYSVLMCALLVCIVLSGSWLFAHLKVQPETGPLEIAPEEAKPEPIERRQLPALLGSFPLEASAGREGLTIHAKDRELHVETTLDEGLQAYVEDLLGRSLTHRAAVVALNPVDGRILALASYASPESGVTENLCIKADYPAASLFKIVAASAAIESKHFRPERTLTYQGRRYTLYKKQLRQTKKDRYTHEISFKSAFSSSINPVFGKIGIYHLGQELLQQYAERFLFNAPIPLELPLAQSSIEVPSDDFGLAEIASGFNKRTRISPVHAALIAASIANDGTMMTPWVVRRVRDARGTVLYRADIQALATPIATDTARQMQALMRDTVEHGTCRKTFYKLLRKKAFQELEVGAKTGTINDRQDVYKFDWLSAFVLTRDGRSPICMAVLAIHGKKLGIRAKDLARYILEHHFAS